MSPSDERSSKRQRISQACETCRRRKSKCDGAQPICTICASNNRTCTYDNGIRRRGLQVGYVRSLEILLGLLIRDLPYTEGKLRQRLRSSDIGKEFFTSSFVDPVTEIWHRSTLHDDLKRLLKHHEEGIEANVECLSPLPAETDLLHSSLQSVLTPQPVNTPVLHTRQILGGDVSDLPDDTLELVDWYFLHLHCWLPIVSRRDILYILHSGGSDQAQHVRDEGRKACLFSIVALVLTLCKPLDQNAPKLKLLLDTIKSQIAIADQDFAIGHIQAALLLVLTVIARGESDTAWIILGQTSRKLAVLKAKCSDDSDRLPHVGQACELLDVFVSASMGKLPCANWQNLSEPLLDEEGIEEWEVWCDPSTLSQLNGKSKRMALRALSTFNHTTQLMRRLGSLLCTFPLEHTLPTTLASLRQWRTILPSYCIMSNAEAVNPCVLSLTLFYNFALASLLLLAHCPISETSTAKDAADSTLCALRQYTSIPGFAHPLLQSFVSQCLKCLQIYGATGIDHEISELIQDLRVMADVFNLHQHRKSPNHQQESPVRVARAAPTDRPVGYDNRILPNDNIFTSVSFGCLNMHSLAYQAQNFTDRSGDAGSSPPLMFCASYDKVDTASHDSLDNGGNNLQLPLSTDYDNLLDNDFDALLDELPLSTEEDESSAQQQFAFNLGFLTDNLDHHFPGTIMPSSATSNKS